MYAVRTSQPMSLQELYEAIKDEDFEAGEPVFCKHGGLFYDVIAFSPSLGMRCQVWILGKKGTFEVMVSGKSMAKSFMKGASGRFEGSERFSSGNLKARYGSKSKAADAFARDAAAVIEGLGL